MYPIAGGVNEVNLKQYIIPLQRPKGLLFDPLVGGQSMSLS
jgi:hypothetical protein